MRSKRPYRRNDQSPFFTFEGGGKDLSLQHEDALEMANLRFIASSQTFADAELKVYSNFIVYRGQHA
jgi:hypothetical protein